MVFYTFHAWGREHAGLITTKIVLRMIFRSKNERVILDVVKVIVELFFRSLNGLISGVIDLRPIPSSPV